MALVEERDKSAEAEDRLLRLSGVREDDEVDNENEGCVLEAAESGVTSDGVESEGRESDGTSAKDEIGMESAGGEKNDGPSVELGAIVTMDGSEEDDDDCVNASSVGLTSHCASV